MAKTRIQPLRNFGSLKELAEKIWQATDVSQTDARIAIVEYWNILMEQWLKEGSVCLPIFGKVCVQEKQKKGKYIFFERRYDKDAVVTKRKIKMQYGLTKSFAMAEEIIPRNRKSLEVMIERKKEYAARRKPKRK